MKLSAVEHLIEEIKNLRSEVAQAKSLRDAVIKCRIDIDGTDFETQLDRKKLICAIEDSLALKECELGALGIEVDQ